MELKETKKHVWEVAKEGDMRVPGRIYADETIINHLKSELTSDWSALKQVINVAALQAYRKHR